MSHVFKKANLICTILLFVFVVGNRFLIVFLSWLNSTLSGDCTGAGGQEVWVVSLVFFLVAYLILCMPGVPNGPVFILAGLLLTNSFELVGGLDFWLAMFLVTLISLGIQLLACATQDKVIGRSVGHKVSMRSWVGMNSMIVKATKVMIDDPGISMRKIVAYVGIPVTNFLLGVTHMNRFKDEMINCTIGFYPVIIPAVEEKFEKIKIFRVFSEMREKILYYNPIFF